MISNLNKKLNKKNAKRIIIIIHIRIATITTRIIVGVITIGKTKIKFKFINSRILFCLYYLILSSLLASYRKMSLYSSLINSNCNNKGKGTVVLIRISLVRWRKII